MREVSEGPILETVQQAGLFDFVERVPTHMRDSHVARKTLDLAGQDAEALRRGRFFARFEQTLQPHADS